MINFEGQVIVITGGCGTLGAAMAVELELCDATVVILDMENQNPREYAKKITSHDRIFGFAIDITDETSVKDVFSVIVSEFGQINSVINSAAATGEMIVRDGGEFPSFEETPLESWKKVMDVNITGNFLIAREIGPIFIKQEHGNLLNVSSIYGIRGPDHRIYEGQPFSSFAAYSASKAAVHGLTMWLATYWAAKHIRVNTLVPGGVFNDHNDEFSNSYSNRTPLGRMAVPSDMVGMALFLISNRADYITGQQFIVDGGLSAW